jgi:Ca-activated chloride channel family protein
MKTPFLVIALLSTAMSLAQPVSGTLKGHVTDANTGMPLPNVNVILMQDGQLLSAQGTSANGNYMYEKIYPNTFDVVFAVKGRTLETREVKGVEVQAGMITTLNVAIGDKEIFAEEVNIRPDPFTNPIALAIVLPVDKKSDEVKEEFKGQYYPFIPEQDFVQVKEKPNSTFSADVDNAFYTIVRRMIAHGVRPPAGAVRIEEMLNYFDYQYPVPANDDFAVYSETAICPWNTDHLLVHIGIQSREIVNDMLPPANFVFLMDVSGSMGSSDKLPLAQSSMRTLIRHLRPQDRVSIVTYREDVSVVIENIPGHDKATILKALSSLHADGSTAGAPGLLKAYEIAGKYLIKEGNNRVILCSDGDFNVGPSSDDELLQLISAKRKSGVYLTVLGFGMDNLQDGKLELLADKGNGNYGYISNVEEARKLLVEEMGGTLVAVAKDVKMEAVFNPQYAKAYRLIGYENRMLSDAEYSQRKTDAGDVGAGQSFTALYEVIPATEFVSVENTWSDHTLMRLEIRYKTPRDAKNSNYHKLSTEIIHNNQSYSSASETFRFSAAVAAFGLLLRDSKFKGSARIDQVETLAAGSLGADKNGYRADFLNMLQEYKRLK